ncbi:MAG: TolC family protein [Deltaproteobacteria bacterium]|nr:TolC family protein [Deltaproteobacteria bacterium]
MKRVLGTIILLVMTTAHFASAAPAVQWLTLKGAITMALENNNGIKAAGFNAEAARRGVEIAGSYYPNLSFEETLTASNAPTQTFMMKLDQSRFNQNDFLISNLNHPGTWHDFKTALTIRQPLYTPSLSPARAMATQEARKEALGLEAGRQEVAFRTFLLYLDIQRNLARLKAANRAVSDARENMRLAKVRSDAGVGLRSDELRAQTHLSSVEQQLITAHNNLTVAKLQLGLTAGLPEGMLVEISEPVAPVAVSRTPEDLITAALGERSDLMQYRAGLERADAAVGLARSAYLPTVGAIASYQLNARETPFGADNDAWMAGVSLKWQLFDGFQRGNEHARATAGRSAAAEMLEGRIREVRFQVQEGLLRREETGKRLEVARHAVLDAEETVRLLTRRFENSLATMVELLDAQTALDQARAMLVDTEAGYALAGARVYYTAGIFLKEIMK